MVTNESPHPWPTAIGVTILEEQAKKRRRVAAGKKGLRHCTPIEDPQAGFKFCIGKNVFPEEFFEKVDTGAKEVLTVDISSRRNGSDFLVWLGYRRHAQFPLYHLVSEIQGKMSAARGKRSKAMWKGKDMVLDLEVRGQIIQVVNNAKRVQLIVNNFTHAPLPWFVTNCAEDDKSAPLPAVGEPMAGEKNSGAVGGSLPTSSVVGEPMALASVAAASTAAGASSGSGPVLAGVEPSDVEDAVGSDSDTCEMEDGEEDVAHAQFLEDLRREVDMLKKSPAKGIYWCKSKHAFIVTQNRKTIKHFSVKRFLDHMDLEAFVGKLREARLAATLWLHPV